MSAWVGRFIAADDRFAGAPLLRREIVPDREHGEITRATLRLSALGIVEAYLGRSRVGDDLLTPGWTSYEWRLRYVEHEVTSLLDGTPTVLGLALGNGWYAGRLAWGDGATPYGEEIAGFAELRITFADGHEQLIATAADGTWHAGASGITANSLYDGQDIDARAIPIGWTSPAFDAAGWVGVHEVAYDLAQLEPMIAPPIRPQLEITPQQIWTSPSGKILVDFGQNLVGIVRVQIRGEAGSTITLRHAEVLEHDELGTRPLRAAKATDRVTLSGGDDVFTPTFTFHGFRYVELSDWPGGIDAIAEDALTAIVIASDLPRIGHFQTSHPQLNRLHENVVWGMRGNFVDVPTDCPQRDERLGWTGDIAAFAPTASFLFDTTDFLRDWLHDLTLEQTHQDGIVPHVIPDILKRVPGATPQPQPTALWSDAAVWVPWAVWQASGRRDVLFEQYDSMTAHVRRLRDARSPNGVWDTGFQYGDWLDPDAPPEHADQAKADKGVVATACAYRSATLVAEVARILGADEDRTEFVALAQALRAAFHDVYVRDERIHSDCTTVYTLAIAFGLLDADELVWAGNRLAELVVESGYHISTGFAGTPFITDALTLTGHLDAAYRLLLQTECPSWLYPVTMGATTIWERWDSMLPDGTINPGEMTSFNHYALGAVADWMHRVIGGIAPIEAGYRRILIAPQLGGDLTWAETSLVTRYGKVRVRWERGAGELRLDAEIPHGATAVVMLPGIEARELASGAHTITAPA